MKRLVILSVIAALAVLVLAAGARAESHTFKTIQAEALKMMMDQRVNMVVVDARTAEEYAQGHLPGAINVSPDKYSYIAGFLPLDKDIPVVFYCRGYN